MKRVAGLLAAAAFSTHALAESPLSPEDALKSFQFADPAMRISLVAAEPLIESPCAIAFDEFGRLFVAENRGYPSHADPPQGRIALLTDTDGDGRMDKRTTFADALTFPNGVMPWQGGLIVTCAPDVLFLKDTTGDGVADEKKVLLTGFDTKGSTQLRVNCPTLGPDGWIYFAAGLAGGSITAPGRDAPPVKMTGDLRWQPFTGEIENVDGRSQFGMSFDDFGRRFICMNRVPVQHVVLQSKWLRRNPHLAFSDTVQDCNERTVKTGLKGGGDGVRLFPISSNITTADSHAGSFSAACAITIWRGGALPDSYRGGAFTCDPTGNLVHADKLTPRGATFAASPMFEGREFLASRDDWFRPVFLASGPDGALYVADMYRKVIEHPEYLPEEVRKRTDFESGKAMGRIWRVKGDILSKRSAQPAAVGSKLLEEALALGDSPTPEAIERLAAIGFEANDRWLQAAVLSSVPGRERDLIKALTRRESRLVRSPLPLYSELARMLGGQSRGEHALDDAIAIANEGGSVSFDVMATLLASFCEGAGVRIPVEQEDETRGKKIFHMLFGANRLLADETEPILRRELGLRVLSRGTWAAAGTPLLATATDPRLSELHAPAVRALAAFDQVEVVRALIGPGRWATYSPTQRETVLSALLANPAQIGGILDAIESSRLPASAIPSVRRNAFLKHTDADIRARAERIFAAATPGDRQQAFDNAKAALALKADAKHGRELFKTHCATCHRLDREGHGVGPDLLDMRLQPKESILFHIVVPDAEVAPAFAAYMAETNDGRALAGVLASETATSITLRGPLAQETSLLRSEIKKLEALPNSLMPPGLEAAMSRQDLADLLAYLKGEATK